MTRLHPIQCRCGSLHGTLTHPERALRLICYCRDCQTYAHALGQAETVLDANGGTAIVAARQSQVSFTHGREQLACMSLTAQGIYRWYAACCRTPIANITRRPQMSYVGLVHACLSPSMTELAEHWPTYFCVNTAQAKYRVDDSGTNALLGALSIARRVLGARLTGSWRQSPFFMNGSGQAMTTPQVLTPEQLRAARSAV